MAVKRSGSFRRSNAPRAAKRPRMTGRKSLAPLRGRRGRRSVASQVHTYKRMVAGGAGSGVLTITGNAVYNPYVSNLVFDLNALVSSSEFTQLYDQYRILTAVTKFWLKIDPSAQSAANASYPKLYWYRDYDDSVNPSNLNEMRQNARCKVAVMHPNRPVTLVCKPNTLGLVYQSVLGTQTEPKWKQWLDCNVPSTPHYGFKYAIDDLTNTNYKVEIEITLYFQCRNSR